MQLSNIHKEGKRLDADKFSMLNCRMFKLGRFGLCMEETIVGNSRRQNDGSWQNDEIRKRSLVKSRKLMYSLLFESDSGFASFNDIELWIQFFVDIRLQRRQGVGAFQSICLIKVQRLVLLSSLKEINLASCPQSTKLWNWNRPLALLTQGSEILATMLWTFACLTNRSRADHESSLTSSWGSILVVPSPSLVNRLSFYDPSRCDLCLLLCSMFVKKNTKSPCLYTWNKKRLCRGVVTSPAESWWQGWFCWKVIRSGPEPVHTKRPLRATDEHTRVIPTVLLPRDRLPFLTS